jgi:hypothetical protein
VGGCRLLFAIGLVVLSLAANNHAASSIDAGGRRVSSVSYVNDGTLGALGGAAQSGVSSIVVRHGYAGQLCDVSRLAIKAAATNVNEAGSCQLSAQAVLDDGTWFSLVGSSLVWSRVSGPVSSISAGGLVTVSNVYQDMIATVRGDYLTWFSSQTLAIANVGLDDFGAYANDEVEDSWQVRYFGLSSSSAGANGDPDHDGMNNLAEYLADTNPTNTISCLRILSARSALGTKVSFQSSTNRRYTLYYRTNLQSGAWTNIPSQTDVSGHGGTELFTDPELAAKYRFYRVGVHLP